MAPFLMVWWKRETWISDVMITDNDSVALKIKIDIWGAANLVESSQGSSTRWSYESRCGERRGQSEGQLC
ncbi:hypothetical protein M404DRAFT_374150 [Pisolithus tinctorius Marx 270]|uniref:Uncharacterized protein n=1 Tax=Pisolithus tinctorius Marx 270 TaxID=870435 RepID=A0A0C3IC07_PISTI|nr:hypothetical protein M404DRAFT_374150 [Pisolithus tinctorius Marx 270]